VAGDLLGQLALGDVKAVARERELGESATRAAVPIEQQSGADALARILQPVGRGAGHQAALATSRLFKRPATNEPTARAPLPPMPEKIPAVRVDVDTLSEREAQIIAMLISLQEMVLRAPFIAAGRTLSPAEARHISDDVALLMSAAFPDLHFYVEMRPAPAPLPRGPKWPRSE